MTRIGWLRVVCAPDVRDRNGARLLEGSRRVEPGDPRDDLLARAEAVVAVPLLGPDRVVGDVARHVEQLEVEPLAGVRGRVRDGEEVVRPRLEADRGIERVTRRVRRRGRQREQRKRGNQREQPNEPSPAHDALSH